MTKFVDDPDYLDLKREFRIYLKRFHSQYDYSSDWDSICQSLDIAVRPTPGKSAYTRLGEQHVIMLNQDEPPTRQAFTHAHELCHYLFQLDDEDFQALLKDKYSHLSDETLTQMEEEVCYEGAGILLFPDHEVQEVLAEHGLHPAAVFALVEKRGSTWAALRRLIDNYPDSPKLWGMILNRTGTIDFTHTNNKYAIRANRLLDLNHPAHAAWTNSVNCRARLPFEHPWSVSMRAARNGRRIVALMAHPEFPVSPSKEQASLFSFAISE